MTNIRLGYLQQVLQRFEKSLVKDVRKLENDLKSINQTTEIEISQVNASQQF